jgi:hypothetical protein
LLCLSLHSAHALAAADVLVTSLRGEARHDNAAVKALDQLSYQQRVDVADGAQLVLVDLRSAQQYVLRGPGRFVLERDDVRLNAGGGGVQRKQLPAAYRGIGLDEGSATHAGAVLRAAEPADDSAWPVFAADQRDERIATRGATLRWPARPHKGAWRLRISELDGTPVYQAAVTPNQAVLPETVALAPAHDYRRELEWRGPGGIVQSSSVVLRTLSSDQTQQLKALAPSADTPPPERLLYALWLRSLGVRGLAEDHACLLHQENC